MWHPEEYRKPKPVPFNPADFPPPGKVEVFVFRVVAFALMAFGVALFIGFWVLIIKG
jgi:hypothetical protein